MNGLLQTPNVLGRGEAAVGDKVIIKAEEIMIYIQKSTEG